MTEVNKVSGATANSAANTDLDIKLADINKVYTTSKKEEDRTTFEETYYETSLEDSEQGEKFLNSLIENKSSLMSSLGLNDEEYDSLSCVALALASQETGMGEEDGYKGENEGIGGFFRGIAKWFSTTLFGDSSSSSGLTQMKIYDFLNSDSFPQELKDVLKDNGIEATGANSNNLYENPDKAAIATVVVLKSLNDNYGNYTDQLNGEHAKIGQELKTGTEEENTKKGEETINNIASVYNKTSDEEKDKIRNSMKEWLLSQNGSKKGDNVENDYNEEIQLEELNELLKNNGANFELSQDSLNYIRYYLTSDGEEMTPVEYMAYAWNKGTGETGTQLDRMLADKIGTIFCDPEDMDYDQFTANVSMLSEKYANQSTGKNGKEALNNALK